MKKFILVLLILNSLIFASFAQTIASDVPLSERAGTYISEEYIQFINSKHSYKNAPFFGAEDKSEIKNAETRRPNVFIVWLSGKKKDELRISYNIGEDVGLEKQQRYNFFKVNESVYAVDDKGVYYFKISDNCTKAFESETEYVSTLFQNYIFDLKVPFVNLQDRKLSSPIGYESPYFSGKDTEGNKIQSDFVYGSYNFFCDKKEIKLFYTKQAGRYDYDFEKTALIIPVEYNIYERCEKIVLRSNDLLVPEEVKTLSYAELRKLRNTIFAKYGHQFKSQDLIEYFGKKYWYKPSSAIAESCFTAFDLRNIEIIRQFEK